MAQVDVTIKVKVNLEQEIVAARHDDDEVMLNVFTDMSVDILGRTSRL